MVSLVGVEVGGVGLHCSRILARYEGADLKDGHDLDSIEEEEENEETTTKGFCGLEAQSSSQRWPRYDIRRLRLSGESKFWVIGRDLSFEVDVWRRRRTPRVRREQVTIGRR